MFPDSDVEAYVQAAGRGDFDAVRAFLAAGMPVDAETHTGTALIHAIDNPVMIQFLLSAGANVNGPQPEPGGLTPLISAALFGRSEIVRLLLGAGANPNFRSYFPRQKGKTQTALDYAR